MSDFGAAARAAQQAAQQGADAARRANQMHQHGARAARRGRGGGSAIGRLFGFVVTLAVLAVAVAVFAAVFQQADPDAYERVLNLIKGLG
jgi:hypothetical protein